MITGREHQNLIVNFYLNLRAKPSNKGSLIAEFNMSSSIVLEEALLARTHLQS
jgi:hypothetical protein